MLKEVKITLYDIFGYLLPGFIFFTAIVILFWTICYPRVPFVLMNLNNAAALILIILIAYYLGHFAQALGNLLSKLFPNVEELMLSGDHSDGIPNTILEAVRLKISETFDVEVSELKPEWVYAICDETVMQNGVSLDREVYQYREGFYRGMGISLLLFSLSIIIRGIVPGAFFRISGADQSINCTIVLFIFFISLGGSILSYLRYLQTEWWERRKKMCDY